MGVASRTDLAILRDLGALRHRRRAFLRRKPFLRLKIKDIELLVGVAGELADQAAIRMQFTRVNEGAVMANRLRHLALASQLLPLEVALCFLLLSVPNNRIQVQFPDGVVATFFDVLASMNIEAAMPDACRVIASPLWQFSNNFQFIPASEEFGKLIGTMLEHSLWHFHLHRVQLLANDHTIISGLLSIHLFCD